jgi:hypothetical protein
VVNSRGQRGLWVTEWCTLIQRRILFDAIVYLITLGGAARDWDIVKRIRRQRVKEIH